MDPGMLNSLVANFRIFMVKETIGSVAAGV